jgi:hypothetical protein
LRFLLTDIVEFLEALLNGLSAPEDVDFDLLFRYFEYSCNLFIRFAFEITQLYAAALFLGQAVYNLPDPYHLIPLYGSVGWRQCVVRTVNLCPVYRFVLIAALFDTVEGEIPANGKAESLYMVYFVPLLPPVPNLNERFLYDILGFCFVERNAQRKAIKLILQREDIVSETYILHD